MPGTGLVPSGDTLEDIEINPTSPLEATVVPPSGPTTIAPPLLNAPMLPTAWRYQMKAEIARGGMGRVVEADDGVLGRVVALKEALSRDPESLRRFERETRITARLEHPSIVPVHDAGVSPNGAPFYVMRKISGRPLEELVAAHAPLAQRLALLPNIVAAAHAIAHAHERGVVHRDIKPANILVGDLGETIVIDWGLAKTMGENDDAHGHAHPSAAHQIIDDGDVVKTRAGIVYGTPGFMSPEQLRGKPIDETSDVYALGATLYYLLGRRPPHYAPTGDAMMQAAVAGPAVPIRELELGVPPEPPRARDHRRQGARARLAQPLSRRARARGRPPALPDRSARRVAPLLAA
jgi:serine/threonine protein kinase